MSAQKKLIIRNHISSSNVMDIHITLGELKALLELLETQNTVSRLLPGDYILDKGKYYSDTFIRLKYSIDDDYDIVINNF